MREKVICDFDKLEIKEPWRITRREEIGSKQREI